MSALCPQPEQPGSGPLEQGPYQFGAESLEFYQGQTELDHMLKQYGSHLEGLRTMKIPADEIGASSYDGSYNGLKFKPVPDSKLLQTLFSVADRMLQHDVDKSGRFKESFAGNLENIMSTKVLDYPKELRFFKK